MLNVYYHHYQYSINLSPYQSHNDRDQEYLMISNDIRVHSYLKVILMPYSE